MDIFQSDDRIYLVMELVKGGDLFDRVVARGKFTEANARKLMTGILKAVSYLHSRSIVHRDLKPENILLVHADCDTEAKITDFGLAKRTTSEGLKTFCGTPQYFAPEVLKRRNTKMGTGRYGREADMWSIGVILYILLSGTPPFNEDTLFQQIQAAKYSFEGEEWEGVSDSAKDLVSRLLTSSPTARLKVDQALHHPWLTRMEQQVLKIGKATSRLKIRLRGQPDENNKGAAVSEMVGKDIVDRSNNDETKNNPISDVAMQNETNQGIIPTVSLSSYGSKNTTEDSEIEIIELDRDSHSEQDDVKIPHERGAHRRKSGMTSKLILSGKAKVKERNQRKKLNPAPVGGRPSEMEIWRQ